MSGERVVVVFGGRSGEHEVSVTSARGVMAALAAAGFDVVPLGIDRRGGWLSEPATAEQLASGKKALSDGAPILEAADALETLHGADVVFPLVHGTFGEDGTLQGFFEIANVPYCGAGVAASAIGMAYPTTSSPPASRSATIVATGISMLAIAVLEKKVPSANVARISHPRRVVSPAATGSIAARRASAAVTCRL